MSERASIHRQSFLHVSSERGVAYHAAPVWKLVVGVDCELEVVSPRGDARVRAALVGPDLAQSIRAEGVVAAFFAEPGSSFAPFAPGRPALHAPGGAELDRLVTLATEAARGRCDAGGDAGYLDDAFGALSIDGRRRIDRRVERVLEALAAGSPESMASLAAAVRLSPDRLRHLASSEAGVPLRRYRLWHRTLAATQRILGGATLAAAAVDEGFSDHPHFTRSFVGFFGRAPSEVAMEARVVAPYGLRGPGSPAIVR